MQSTGFINYFSLGFFQGMLHNKGHGQWIKAIFLRVEILKITQIKRLIDLTYLYP